jgi:nicotinate-nucleotide adenylyltransferase
MRLGVFGGTFNPIHYGHLRAAEDVIEHLGLDRVIFVPTGTPPLKFEELVSSQDRYTMTELAISTNSHFEISDIEFRRPEISYTVDTAERLREMHPGDDLFFIAGIDSFMDLPRWREPERLVGLVDFVIISRPGHAFCELELSPFLEVNVNMLKEMDGGSLRMYNAELKGKRIAALISVTPFHVSATAIRTLVGQKRSIKYLLPETVESFIMSNGLYVG